MGRFDFDRLTGLVAISALILLLSIMALCKGKGPSHFAYVADGSLSAGLWFLAALMPGEARFGEEPNWAAMMNAFAAMFTGAAVIASFGIS